MRRRVFLHSILQATVAGSAANLLDGSTFGPLAVGPSPQTPKLSKSVRPQIALTMDDPKLDLGGHMRWQEANHRILRTLDTQKLKAALFVCGMRIDQPEGAKLLSAWNDAGHLLCSHSYSHLMYMRRTSYDEFAADFLRNEPIIAPYRQRTRLFRYPFLKEGNTAEKRDKFRQLLKEQNYRVGHVTIDASDWYVDERMQERLGKNSKAEVKPYRDYLIQHLLERATFYRQLALDALGHEIRHTLLVHFNMINALFLSDVIKAFKQAGWDWIDADRAFEDPVFLREPQTVPAGESIVWAIAAEDGRFKDRLRWPGEDGPYEEPKMDKLGL